MVVFNQSSYVQLDLNDFKKEPLNLQRKQIDNKKAFDTLLQKDALFSPK